MMDQFKFVVKEYFILRGNMVGFIGKMLPEEFCIVNSKDYDMKLYSSDKLIHTFNTIGEEISISYSGNKIKSRALRTFDDIATLLKKNLAICLYWVQRRSNESFIIVYGIK